jgi:nicotinate-nucleotide adenylyltransferase
VNMKKIGIYSGTFDPVHTGHLAFAREAMKQCGLDKIFFLVEPRPRRKQGVKAFEHRAEMVRLAIQDEPKFGSIMLGQQRFTPVDTLPLLQERFKGAELHMLMGDDMLAHFADWPHVEELMQNIQFVIGMRVYSADEVKRRISIVQKTRGLAMKYKLFQAPNADFSSSKIRQQVKNGQQPEGLAPEVLAYIQEQRLYSAKGSSIKS